MKTPKHARVLWLITGAAFLSLPFLAFLWNKRVSSGDQLSPDTSTGGDSFGLPFVSLTVLVVIVLTIVSLVLRLILRPYPGAVDLFPSPQRRWRLILIDTVTMLLLVGCLLFTASLVRERDYEFLPIAMMFCYLLVALRATTYSRLVQHMPRPSASSDTQ